MSRLFHSQRHAACSVDYPQAARLHVLAASLVLAVAAGSFAIPRADAQPVPSAAGSAVHAINLPAAPLGQSLNNLAQQTGVQIIFAGQLTEGKDAPALHGSYTAANALQRLLAGSGLTALARDAKTFTVTNTSDAGADGGVLAPVMVTAERPGDLPAAYAGGQVARGGRLGMLGNVDVMGTPFNVTNYTSQLIEDQQATNIIDVLQNEPSVRQSASTGSMSSSGLSIRGFGNGTQAASVTFDGLHGMVPDSGALTAEFAERVEMLKGPSALLYGMPPNGDVSGAINLVPKRAGDKPLTRLTLGVESDSLWKGHVDMGRRFGANNEWGLRFNGSYKDGDGYIDGAKRGGHLGALALDYRGERLRMSLDAYRQQEKLHGAGFMNINITDWLPAAPDPRTNILPGAPETKETTEAIILSGEYDFNDRWIGYAKLGVGRSEFRGFSNANIQDIQANGDAVWSRGSNQAGDIETQSAETGLRGRFQTGAVTHSLALSASYMNRDRSNASTSGANQPTNIYAPAPIVGWPAPPTYVPKTSESTLSGVSLADTLGFMDDRVLLTLGVRRQNVKATNFNDGAVTGGYDASAWSPMAALVVKPTDDLSLYANYIQGLSQGTTVGNTYQNAGQVFPPYKTKQVEVGAKLQTGSFTNTISVFEIAKPSTTTDNSTSPLPTLRLDGEQRNRGIEWATFGELTRGLRMLGGVTYIQGKLTKTQGGLQDGNRAAGSVPWAANLGLDWDVRDLPGLALSGRVIYTSSQWADHANSVKMPSWTRLDIGARYATRLGGKDVVFRANVDNVFDKTYWQNVFSSGRINLGAPRIFRLSATIDF